MAKPSILTCAIDENPSKTAQELPTGCARINCEGCIIFVDPERRSPTNGERIIAKLNGSDEVSFKVCKEEDGRRWPKPLNMSHVPIRYPFKVLGTVMGSGKMNKRLLVNMTVIRTHATRDMALAVEPTIASQTPK